MFTASCTDAPIVAATGTPYFVQDRMRDKPPIWDTSKL
jgi:hypothetical protein